jgi:hypothetical protein
MVPLQRVGVATQRAQRLAGGRQSRAWKPGRDLSHHLSESPQVFGRFL